MTETARELDPERFGDFRRLRVISERLQEEDAGHKLHTYFNIIYRIF